MVSASYLEGSYTECFPRITADADGMAKLFRQFSSPGGIPSHASVTTPGSIHEGGEGLRPVPRLRCRLRQPGSDRRRRRR
ncbi:conserved hypothetical protein [Corynebacterium efficiens YS-314]|uniref:Xylulose 5-phosphate/Fructose 6-phosphate phosphoketolase N-terminal domain-containing protein n=1 Tax=Corynebacterium efficiens (strain DSM 44549 / YS-314 / AJ 12310 / JCM 11189 / NBRC 100395) TaxID=196164 RepID=Q8FSI8_COREF|nr:conserved hypothetical protein [Corynebacterium efficiens YS-314]